MVVILLTVRDIAPNTASAASGGGPEMGISLLSGGVCGPVSLTCYVPIGEKFEISIDAIAIPVGGFGRAQAWIQYGDELGDQTNGGVVKSIDPDAHIECQKVTFGFSDEGGNSNLDSLSWSCRTGLIDPIPQSFSGGALFTVSLTCTQTESATLIELVPLGEIPAGSSGAKFTSSGVDVAAKVDDLTINCIGAGDTDGDGCSDLQEIGLDEKLGGLRDPFNPSDFYDVLGPGAVLPKDGIIDLPNDILGVIQHYAPTGTELGYSLAFDRGPSTGPNPWNMTAPDGVIDLANDILGVVFQFGHSCQ